MSSIIETLIAKLLNDLNLFSNDYITVAELKTVEIDGLIKTIDVNTALVSPSLITKIRASHTNPYVNSIGINYDKDFIYFPSFWLYLSQSNGLRKAEPLVVSWESCNNTTLMIEQGFVGTFKLIPRFSDGRILWDDLSKPKYEVVRNKLISQYNFPKHTDSFVQIHEDYLKDYLYLRKKIGIQVFTITQDVFIDTDILNVLEDKDYYIEEIKYHEIRIRKFDHKENIARIEINGYKLLFDNDTTGEAEITNGHYWKGIDGLVTECRARHEMPFQYVYVSDTVLAKYEEDDDYEIYPLYGSVRYKGQWGISHCERIGRNGIKLEIKKIYEGVPDEVIDYWNRFSINITEVEKGENIVLKAEKLTKKYFLFSRLFSSVITRICNLTLTPSDIITLNEERIEYTGWKEFPDYMPITNHVNIHLFSKEKFISRCKNLYILIGENLQEKSLRRIVNILGFPLEDTETLRSIRLLELILKYIYIVEETGLDSISQSENIIERVSELKEFNYLHELFALNSIRQLDAHKNSKDSNVKLDAALRNFDIDPNSISNNYSKACEQVYDHLDEMFFRINNLLM